MAVIDVSSRPSVQDAWDSVQSGDTILYPGGDWHTSAPLKKTGLVGVTVRGDGPSSRLIGDTDFQSLFTLTECTGWEFRNITLRGPGNGRRITPDQEGTGIQLIRSHSCRIYRCVIQNCGLYDGIDVGIGGIYLREGCSDCEIDHNDIIECNNGVTIDAYVSEIPPRNNRVTDNLVLRCRAGIASDSRTPAGLLGTGLSIRGNTVDGHTQDASTERYAVRCQDDDGAIVAENIIRNVYAGIDVHSGSRGCKISGNTIVNVIDGPYGGYGIWVRGNPGAPERTPLLCSVDGNTIMGTPKSGIMVELGALKTGLIGNTISGARGDGITVAAPYTRVNGGNLIDEPIGHGIRVTGSSGSCSIRVNFIKGNPYDTAFKSNAVHIDALTGGPVIVSGNELWNAQPNAGFGYGIYQADSSPLLVFHGGNLFFRLPAALRQTPSMSALQW